MKRTSAMKRIIACPSSNSSGNLINPFTLRRQRQRRKGSILIIVIALLGMLLLVGITFFTFASQDQVSGTNFSERYKKDLPTLTQSTLFDFAMEQLIVGPPENLHQSALWGRRYSLVGTMLGVNANTVSTDSLKDGHFDTNLFNGQGINLALSGTNTVVDQNFDGTADADQSPLNVNLSYGAQQANGGTLGITAANISTLAQPDVDYTYPDINNMFLAHISEPTQDVNGRRVIIPSFHRPQLLRDSSGVAIPDWYTNSVTAHRIFRPHPEHTLASNSSVKRFINSTDSLTNVLGQTIGPFPFAQDINSNSTSGEMGVWTTPASGDNYDLDTDNDGDGINEGVWLDLDFPVQELPDGRKYVPLFSYTVLDADGLINLNSSGNLDAAEYTSQDVRTTLSNNLPISMSNFGVSRTEISPLWALYADPENSTFIQSGHTKAEDLKQYCLFWGITSGPSMPRTAMANLELLNLMWGRPDFVAGTVSNNYTNALYADPMTNPNGYFKAGDYKLGRWGEQAILQNAVINNAPNARTTAMFPRAGGSGIDDDGDAHTGLGQYDPLTLTSNLQFPSVVHPLDLTGFGHVVDLSASFTSPGRRAYLTGGNPGDPNRWLTYVGFQDPGPVGTTWSNLVTPNLMLSPVLSALSAMGAIPTPYDEDDEAVTEPLLAGTTGSPGQAIKQDSAFGPEEMVGLHVADTDYANIAGSSRIRDLAPFNFQSNSKAAEIRRQFTTLSFDRAEFGTPPSAKRSWENTNFPPTYFRPEVKAMLTYPHRQRLMLNGVLVKCDVNNRPQYRSLTPHPTTGLTNTPVTTPANFTQLWQGTASPSTANDQEFMARYDRQILAKDIFLMLYTLGGGLDGPNYATTPSTTLYSAQQLNEMAQFAVNMVDAMDRDNVITRFEYNTNPSDPLGWQLDDNPFTTTDSVMNGSRLDVYGVEAQQLCISEFMAIQAKAITGMGGNAQQWTQWDDTIDRFFTYMELRNTSPYPIDFGNQSWQIQIIPDQSGAKASKERRLILKSGSIVAGGLFSIGGMGDGDLTDPNDATKRAPSYFKVAYDGNNAPDFTTNKYRVAPLHGTLNLDLIPADKMTYTTYGDTFASPTTKYPLFEIHEPTTVGSIGDGKNIYNIGELINSVTVDSSNPNVTVVLRRRLNPYRTAPNQLNSVPVTTEINDHNDQSADNPWIEVDRVRFGTNDKVPLQSLALTSASTVTDLQTQLQNIVSSEHQQPFDPARHAGVVTTVTLPAPQVAALGTYSKNSLGGLNESTKLLTNSAFTVWQPCFDREFVSVYDVLSIPLYGPDNVTKYLLASQGMSSVPPNSTGTGANRGTEYLAAKKFLRPIYNNGTDDPSTLHLTDPDYLKYDNRWYRILELLEVPTRSNISVQNQVLSQIVLQRWPSGTVPRLPGAINLNTIRQRGVLAGLIDDPLGHMSGYVTLGNSAMSTMLNDSLEGGRDWWRQFIQSRDQLDLSTYVNSSVMPKTTLYLPGLPGARPYRSMTFADPKVFDEDTNKNGLLDPGEDLNSNDVLDYDNPIQHTILRDLSDLDRTLVPNQAQRNLFEARSQSDVGTNAIDYYTRHRLLRKIANNSTQRSNVFIVWMTVDFFEAKDLGSGEVRIGAKLANSTKYRGFFIVDRSQLEKAVASYDPTTGVSFDFRKFIVYQKTLQ